MKVILKEYVYKHGVAGDVVTVADGFARNYLIPRGLAIKATPGALRENQHLIKQATQRREELRSLEHEAAQKIHGVELVFGVKAGKNRKLYGSITTRDIAQALLEKTGVDINRRRISERPLRELGVHEVPVRIAAHVSPVLRVVVIREEELPAYLAGQRVASLAEEQVFEVIEEEETLEAGEAADLEPAGEAEQPGEPAE
ncbi:MAG: 50S ribosomal protein L9 [Chloroflexota bacterium]|jgi:large subunit ribosomal protein L9